MKSGEIKTPYARTVSGLIKGMTSHSFVFTAYDEMVPLLLHFPSLFTASGAEGKNRYYTPADIDALETGNGNNP